MKSFLDILRCIETAGFFYRQSGARIIVQSNADARMACLALSSNPSYFYKRLRFAALVLGLATLAMAPSAQAQLPVHVGTPSLPLHLPNTARSTLHDLPQALDVQALTEHRS